jgi:hypothetical protein
MTSQYIDLPTTSGGGVTSINTLVGDVTISAGTGITLAGSSGNNILISTTGGGSGTVTTVSVVSANGLAGTVANPTTTPAITLSTSITGLLKGNGTAISAATAGTDYVIPSVTTLSSLSILGSQVSSAVANATTAVNFSGSLAGDITGTQGATALTATSNSTLITLSALSLPYSQLTGKPTLYTNPMTTLGDTLYENATPAAARLAGNTTTTKMMLSQTGNGTISAAPVWAALVSGDIPNNAANTSGTAANITASSNSTLTTLSSLSLPTSQLSGDISLTTQVSGTLPIANGGTNATTVAGARTNLGIEGSANFISANGSQTGLLFNISAPGSNVSAGAVYSNNSNNYTVLVAITTAQSGYVLYTSGTGSTSGTTLTLVSGTGPSTITFSGTPQTIFNLTTPSTITTATQVQFTLIGGGGAGSSDNASAVHSTCGGAGAGMILFITGLSPSTSYYATIGAAGAGVASAVGTSGTPTAIIIGGSLYTCGGGQAAAAATGAGGAGGVTNSAGTINISGGAGGGSMGVATSAGLAGGNAPFGFGFGGVGLGGSLTGAGNAATGYGGGGGGAAGTGGNAGGNGAGGCILVEYTN